MEIEDLDACPIRLHAHSVGLAVGAQPRLALLAPETATLFSSDQDIGLLILSVVTLHGITTWQLALPIVYTARAQFAAGAGSKAGRE